ncbi:MAG: DUF4395 family protein, partial [Crocinitomicaceae bacterium]|nr:DUF4395 family protein [Crocinitomicaceae bacterium]
KANPRKFTAGIGFIISFSAFILSFLNYKEAVLILSGIQVISAFLEAFFRIYLGSYLFQLVVRKTKVN